MTITLKKATSIHTGIYANPDAWGDIMYLQAKDFNEVGQVHPLLKPNLILESDNKIGKHLLKDGDILFAAKGHKNFAAIYNESLGPAVASSTFLVVRILREYRLRLSPEFLAWWMNHSKSQQYLKGQAIGSSLLSISKAVLQELEIFIPPLTQQEIILKISELRSREIALQSQIEALREKKIQQLLLNILKD